jgi:enamine deaminase RidA (YjgF/YER057c/UK114 family)
MSKTAITSRRRSARFPRRSKSVVSSFSAVTSVKTRRRGKLVAGRLAAETESVFQNLSAVLKAAGKSFDDVVRAGAYLTSMSDYVALNGILRQAFQAGLSRPHGDRGGRAAAWGLR